VRRGLSVAGLRNETLGHGVRSDLTVFCVPPLLYCFLYGARFTLSMTLSYSGVET
jgi:hypothetical protein